MSKIEQYILLGHGSRNAKANEVLFELAEMFEAQVHMPTRCAFLQFAQPSLKTVIEETIAKNINYITVIPVFLYPGIHIKEDIPEIINKFQAKHETLTVKFAAPIGADPKLVHILQERAAQAEPLTGGPAEED